MELQLKQVLDFHEKFQQEVAYTPQLLSLEESRLRYKLGEEEVKEYLDATNDGDLVEVLDSLADQLYILLGTVLKHGLQDMIIPAFNLVHENNMRKLGPDGKPIFRADGKIMKPEGFEKVELKTLFKQ